MKTEYIEGLIGALVLAIIIAGIGIGAAAVGIAATYVIRVWGFCQ